MILKKNVIYDLYEGEYYGRENVVSRMTNPKPLAIILRASYQKLGSRVRAEDAHVLDFVKQCRDNSVRIGLYHFLTPNGIAEQAALFLSVWNKCGKVDLQPIVDVEVDLNVSYPKLDSSGRVIKGSSSIGNAVWQMHVKTFIDLISAGTGRTPMIYTSQKYWSFVMTKNLLGQMTPPTWTSDYPLWVAQYPYNPDGQESPSVLPSGWTEYKIWQYNDQGGSNGFLANDLNTTTDGYASELGEVEVDPPPVEPNPTEPPDRVKLTFGTTETWYTKEVE